MNALKFSLVLQTVHTTKGQVLGSTPKGDVKIFIFSNLPTRNIQYLHNQTKKAYEYKLSG